MIINLEKAKKNFLEYTEKYDLNIQELKSKQVHSIRVMNISEKIAIKLGLTEEQIQLATLIGLLHDIARFEQFTQYKTFSDIKSFDHGNYGEKILNKDIRKYIETEKYDNLIKTAIRNHNKFKIEDGLNKEELLFSKIIRDADKIDILYEGVEIFWKNKEEEINKTVISPEIMECIEKNQLIERKTSTTFDTIDKVMFNLAFIFDINYKESLEIINENNYINLIIDRFNFSDKEKVRNILLQYIQKKGRKNK